MAAETNGIYGSQYGQPAELAASTPAGPTHAASSSLASTTTSTTAAPKADPQEIGWYFVEQYYTTLSKTPEKIHLFYNKKSQLVTGVEAEKVVPSVGTKAISEKIKALDIQDCKVRVLNVDSQSSFDNIVVQVIGEMSNKSEPHHKFVQTFVLAVQPNGYFVLNDIFRYLNENEDEIVEDEPTQEEIPHEEHTSTVDSVAETHDLEDSVTNEAAAEELDAKLESVSIAEKEGEGSTMDDSTKESTSDEPAIPEESSATTKDLLDEQSVPQLGPEEPGEPEPTPSQSPPKVSTPPVSTESAPAKKTWANMVGTKATAVPALPITTPVVSLQAKSQRSPQPPQASKQATEPAATATSPTQSNGWQNVDGKKQNKPQAKVATEAVTLAYIKNVNDKVDASILRETLESFGELKYFDVSRPRNCAFVEFADPAGYAAAVNANPHDVSGEQIYVEERRPRPTAYGGSSNSFGRGGTPSTRGRGGIQGRTGSQTGAFPKDSTRGNFQQRGAKSGSVTPRGRGQSQVP